MTSRPMPTVLLVLAAATSACADAGDGEGADDEGVTTVMDTVADVVQVRNQGEPAPWRLEETLRLGTLEGGPEEFGRIRSLLADDEGNVYVAENISQEIRVFDASGRHLRSIGRQGAGPGEFGNLYSLAWLGDRLAALDPGNARIGLLSPEGEWTGQIRHFPITGSANVTRLHPLGEDGFYTTVIRDAHQRLPYARFTADGPADTLAHPAAEEDIPTSGVVCSRPDGGIQSIMVPEAPRLVFAFAPPGERIALSWTDDYRMAVTDATGDTVRTITHDREPLPFSDEAWEEGSEPYREMMERFPGTRCEPSSLRRPAHRSALRHILFDEADRMWVEAAAENGHAWEVFDPEGRLLGRAPAPERSSGIPPYVRDGRLYQVETDELDVQYVAVYRLVEEDS